MPPTSAGNDISQFTFYKDAADSSLAGVGLVTSAGSNLTLGRTEGSSVVALYPSVDATGTIKSMSVWVRRSPKDANITSVVGAVNGQRHLFEFAVRAAKHGSGILGIRIVAKRAGGPNAPEHDYSWGAILPTSAEGAAPDFVDAPILPPGVDAKGLEEVKLNVGNGKLAAITLVKHEDGKCIRCQCL